jgi:hypothetical protein
MMHGRKSIEITDIVHEDLSPWLILKFMLEETVFVIRKTVFLAR